jgi:TRAP-type C4-dicarboxylate transport system permease small subunit
MPMRALLQKLYYGCGVLAGVFMILIAIAVLYSIGGVYLGYVARSADDFAGYAMLASSFLALAYTFGKGEHIRVTLVLQRLKGRARRIGEIWCLLAATLLSGFFAWYCVKLVIDSYVFGDKSTGLIPVPLWIPQIAMAVGVVVLFIAVLEQLIVTASGGPLPHDASAEEVMMER